MDTSTKLSKDFLKLLDLIRSKDEERRAPLTRIYCKNNVLYATDSKLLIRCDLKQKDLPKYDLDDGFYEVSGLYLVKDKDFEEYQYPDVERILNTQYEKHFQVSEEYNAYLDFLHTITFNGVFLDFVNFEKQLKQIFKGMNFKVYFINGEKHVRIECDYVVQHIANTMYSPIQVIVMPMKRNREKPTSVDYNPTGKELATEKEPEEPTEEPTKEELEPAREEVQEGSSYWNVVKKFDAAAC